MTAGRLFLFSCLFLIRQTGLSQELWTLDRCIAYAEKNNIGLKLEALRTTSATYDLQQSQLNLLPSVNLGASQSNRFGRSVDPLTYQFTTDNAHGGSVSAYSGVSLFRGFRGINQIKTDQLNLQIQLARFEQAALNLGMQITRSFLEILFEQEALVNAKNQANITQQQIRQSTKLFEAGALTKSVLLELEAQASQEESKIVEITNREKLARLALAQLLDLNRSIDFQIEKPQDIHALMPPEALQFLAGNNSNLYALPAIRAAELAVNHAEMKLRLAKGMLSPEIKLTGGWGTGFSNQILDAQSGNIMGYKNQLDFNSSTYLAFQLTVPVFNQLDGLNTIRQAKLGIQQANLELEAEKQRYHKEIETLRAETQAAKSEQDANEKSLQAVQQAFQDVERRYNLGMLTTTEYQASKGRYIQAESELLVAKYRYIFGVRMISYFLNQTP